MKITISVGGRFHAFDLAKELQDKGYLHQLVTSYPKFEVKKYGIAKDKIKSVVSKEIIERINRKYLRILSNKYVCDWYDYLASKKINTESDVYIIWSSFALKTIKKIRSRNPNAKIILERCSTHIQFQKEILEYAYSLAELNSAKSSDEIIKKERKEYELADYISVPTNFVKKTFIEKGINEGKIFVNPYGVDISTFIQPHKKIDLNRITILFVGMFSIRKGATNFIKIINHFKNDRRINFLLVGGIENQLLPLLKPFMNNGKVMIQSPVKQNLLTKYYALADIFLFPSIEEGLAYVQLQAMASSLVVLSSYNAGAEMIIQHEIDGYVFDPFNVQDYISILEYLIENPYEMIKIGSKASQKIANGFSWQDYGERYITFLDKINGK